MIPTRVSVGLGKIEDSHRGYDNGEAYHIRDDLFKAKLSDVVQCKV